MSDAKYQVALEQAKVDLAQSAPTFTAFLSAAGTRKTHLELRGFIVATSKMLGIEFIDGEDSLGLTDAVRQAFKDSPLPISPVGVEKHFAKIGYDLSNYDSPASATASIHKVVSRLAEKGEIISHGKNPEGRTVYKWAEG